MLSDKKCIPCEGGLMPLSPGQAKAMLAQVPGWELINDDKAIKRSFTFKNYKTALDFVNRVSVIVEAEGHHPNITFSWGFVDILLWTHAIGGLHENDFIIASKINELNS